MDLRPILESDAVRHARERIRGLDRITVERQVELARIPAPSGAESARGAEIAARFSALGLQDVAADEVGNIVARLPGSDATDAPVLVTAHLDTVFASETDLTVRRTDGRISVPGIADNARGLAGMLAVAEVLASGEPAPGRPVVFVATVGEEGAGDLQGVKHLFRGDSPFRRAHAFLSLDGSGIRRIVHRAVGSKRLRLRFAGPGGHSWSDWGLANPVHVLGSCIASIQSIELPQDPRTTLTVARIAGGTSINSIPADAWLELDLRSEALEPIRRLERQVRQRVARAVADENRNRRRRTPSLELAWETIGDRPGGTLAESAPLVRAAADITRALGAEPELVSSSTDSNVPLSLGVPALTVGVGGKSGGIHTIGEWYSDEGGATGLERALLLVLAAAALSLR
jgi:tripeptide aminopeptidase